MSSILVFGATGTIGTPIINELAKELQAGTFQRLAIFTSQNTVEKKSAVIKGLQSQGVEVFVGGGSDNKEIYRDILTGKTSPIDGSGDTSSKPKFDTVINAYGRDAILEQIVLLEVAESIDSVKWYFPSEFGTDVEYDPKTSPSEPPHQLKLQVRKYIKENIKRLSVTYLVTGPYSDLWLGNITYAPRFGTFDVPAKKAFVLKDGEGKVSMTSMADVAKLLVAALKSPKAAQNRALKVNSFTATPNEVVAEFERQTGGQKWEVEYVPWEEVLHVEKLAHDYKSPAASVFTLRRIWAEGGTLYDKRDNEDIGFTHPETLADQVKKAVASQTTSS